MAHQKDKSQNYSSQKKLRITSCSAPLVLWKEILITKRKQTQGNLGNMLGEENNPILEVNFTFIKSCTAGVLIKQ